MEDRRDQLTLLSLHSLIRILISLFRLRFRTHPHARCAGPGTRAETRALTPPPSRRHTASGPAAAGALGHEPTLSRDYFPSGVWTRAQAGRERTRSRSVAGATGLVRKASIPARATSCAVTRP